MERATLVEWHRLFQVLSTPLKLIALYTWVICLNTGSIELSGWVMQQTQVNSLAASKCP